MLARGAQVEEASERGANLDLLHTVRRGEGMIEIVAATVVAWLLAVLYLEFRGGI